MNDGLHSTLDTDRAATTHVRGVRPNFRARRCTRRAARKFNAMRVNARDERNRPHAVELTAVVEPAIERRSSSARARASRDRERKRLASRSTRA
jgi:hypothetical protein